MTKILDELFEIVKQEEESNKKIVPAKTADDNLAEEIDKTHAYTDKVLRDLIAGAEVVLENAADTANQTGHPESIRAYAQLLKNVADVAEKALKALSDREKTKKEKSNPVDNKKDAPNTVNNTQFVFNGTTADLLDKVLEEKNKVVDVSPERT